MGEPKQTLPMPARGLKTLRNALISGVFLLAPLIATIIVFVLLIEYVGAPLGGQIYNALPGSVQNFFGTQMLSNIIGTVLVLVLITLVGLFNNFILGSWLTRNVEKFFLRLPIVNAVYRTVKQIIDTFKEQKKTAFSQVVLVQFPRQGLWSVGFVTTPTKGETARRLNGEYTNIFVPTTPIPTNGFYLMVPTAELIFLDMSVGDGMKMLISGGAVTPDTVPVKSNDDE